MNFLVQRIVSIYVYLETKYPVLTNSIECFWLSMKKQWYNTARNASITKERWI
jgi:hypothetical protein